MPYQVCQHESVACTARFSVLSVCIIAVDWYVPGLGLARVGLL